MINYTTEFCTGNLPSLVPEKAVKSVILYVCNAKAVYIFDLITLVQPGNRKKNIAPWRSISAIASYVMNFP